MPPGPAIATYGPLRYYSVREAVLVARTPAAVYKIARLNFGRDGSIYLQFPYLSDKHGWIGELPREPGQTGPVTYHLERHGSFVDTDVKFSHHRSGVALFSKTGHEVPSTRRQSYPLDGPIGHLFQLQVFHTDGFELLSKPAKRTLHLGFDFDATKGLGIFLRAEWRRKRDVVDSIQPPRQTAGPRTRVQHRATGEIENVYFVGQPPDCAMQGHVLLLFAGPAPIPTGADQPGMVLLAGWDPHEHKEGEVPTNAGTCLSFLYPARPRSAT